MIRSFKCLETKRIFDNEVSRKFPQEIQRTARRKLREIHAAITLRTLANPPGNRLEALKGERTGQHSIRINDQWRVCFVWDAPGPGPRRCPLSRPKRASPAHEVEIVDYH